MGCFLNAWTLQYERGFAAYLYVAIIECRGM